MRNRSGIISSPGRDPEPRRPWFDRRWLAGCCVVAALTTAFGYAGEAWAAMAYLLLTEGAVVAAWLFAGAGYGWVIAPRSGGTLPVRIVIAAGLGLGFIGLMVLGFGLAGVLKGVVAWGIVGVGVALGVAWLARGMRRAGQSDRLVAWWRAGAGWEVLWVVLAPFLGMALFGAMMPPGLLWQDEPAAYDVVEYHLQVPREWHDRGRIEGLKHNVFSYMPMGVEVHYLLAMHLRGGPYTGMYLAQLMHLAFVGLSVWAVAAGTGSLSEKKWAAPLAGVGMGVVPWLTALAPVAYNEGGLLFYGALAMVWAMLARDWRGWALAGGLAGLACGVKLTAVPMLVGGIGLAWALSFGALPAGAKLILLHYKGERVTVKHVGVFVGFAVLVFSPWLIRNVVWTGNPVFPQAMSVLGKAHFTDVQVQRWNEAHSSRKDQRTSGQRFLAAWREIGKDVRYGFAFLPLAFAASILVRDVRAAFLSAMVFFQLAVWLTLTHLQGRFFVLAIPAAAILIGLGRHRVWPAAASCGILLVALTNLIWHGDRFEEFRRLAPGVLGQTNLQMIVEASMGMEQGALPRDGKLVLVGEARAFLYSEIPNLRYRTVFDVPPPANEGAWLDAWAGGEGGPVLVFPGELARFRRTYHAVPTPPESELEARPGPYVIQR